MNLSHELEKRHIKVCDVVRGLDVHRTTVERWLNGTSPLKRIHILALQQFFTLYQQKN